MRRGTSTRGTGTGRGSIPRRGTSSTRAPEPLPRRGTSSARGQPLPRRGTSSAHGAPLPRHGATAVVPAVAGDQPSEPSGGPMTGHGLAPRPGAPARGAFQGSRGAATPPTDTPSRAAEQPRPAERPSGRGRPAPAARAGARGERAAGKADAAPATTERPPPGSLQREDIERRAKTLDEQTYFEILGVDEDADANAVQSAYFKLAKGWHPDRLHASLQDLKPKVAMVFARINEAYQTLSNADKRREYEDTVKHGGGTAKDRQMVERVIDSALLFQKGEVVFRKGSYDQAAEMVRKAADADPDQPEYRALLAWIEAHCLGQPPEDADDRRHFYRDQIKMLDVVIQQEPEYERALFYRGSLLKRSGYAEAALKDFRKVVQLNPRNIDAAREVRLNQMRHKKEEKGGIFGRFFGKDK